MNYFYLTLLLTPIIAWNLNDLECTDTKIKLKEPCDPSDYTKYVNCVLKRQKRQADDCSSQCDQCDCDDCSEGGCSSTCNNCCASSSCSNCDCNQCSYGGCSSNCNSCCQSQQSTNCQTHYCCYRTCHSLCSNKDCRRSCRKSCEDKVDGNIITSGKQSSSLNATNHIRTILEVHNEINNTNIINIPVDVNTTSFNNITVLQSQHSNIGSINRPDILTDRPDFSQSQSHPQPHSRPQPHPQPQPQPHYSYPIPYYPQPESTPCCTIATPRQCMPQPTTPYINCAYQTQRICNNVCQSHQVIHPYIEQVCDGLDFGCHNEVVYSSQQRPMCAFGRSWPYFGCGVPQFQCSGCYDSQFDTSKCASDCNGY